MLQPNDNMPNSPLLREEEDYGKYAFDAGSGVPSAMAYEPVNQTPTEDSFLGQANQAYNTSVEAPELSEQDKYIARLGQEEQRYKASEWQSDNYADKIEAPDTMDRVWNTMFDMGAAFLLSGGNPAAMALAGYASYTKAEDREYRYRQIEEMQRDGYSLDTVRQWVDTGDNRYKAEDRKARANVEQETYKRGIDVRNYDEDVRRDNRNFTFDERKQDEVETAGAAKRKIDIGTLSVAQQRANWETDSKRLDKTIVDKSGNTILLDKKGNEIRVYNAEGEMVSADGPQRSKGAGADDEEGKPIYVWNNETGQEQDVIVKKGGKYISELTGKETTVDLSAKREDGTLLYSPVDATRFGQKVKTQEDKNKSWREEEVAYNKQLSTLNTTEQNLHDLTDEDKSRLTGITSNLPTMRPGTVSAEQKVNSLLAKDFTNMINQVDLKGSLSNAEGSKLTAAANYLTDKDGEGVVRGMDRDTFDYHIESAKVATKNLKKVINYKKQNRGREPSEEWKQQNFEPDTAFVKEYRRKNNIESVNNQSDLPVVGDVMDMPDGRYATENGVVRVRGKRVVSVE